MLEGKFMDILVKEVVFYSIVNSFVVFGIMNTILKILDKEEVNRFVGLGVTYFTGMIFGFMFSYDGTPLWQKFVWGISVGAVSVSIYKSAVQSLLTIIPSLVDRIFNNNQMNSNKETEGN